MQTDAREGDQKLNDPSFDVGSKTVACTFDEGDKTEENEKDKQEETIDNKRKIPKRQKNTAKICTFFPTKEVLRRGRPYLYAAGK